MGKPPKGKGIPNRKKKNYKKEHVTVSGRIGKPQKSKKNKKMKSWDPAHMGDRKGRSNLLRNFKPQDDDDQEVPRKVKHHMRNKNKFKQQVHMSRNDKIQEMRKMGIGHTDTVGAKRPMKPIPVFEQGEYETDEIFLQRVSRETREVLEEVKLEEKIKGKVDEEDSILAEESDTLKQETKKAKNKDKKIERLKTHRQQKAEKKKEDIIAERETSFDKLQDKVLFGEVAMRPPNLTVKPRKATDIVKGRPGNKSLLLKQIISDNATHFVNVKASKRDLGKSVKRKHLSAAQQKIMDSERERVIDLYRSMRGKKDITFNKISS